MWRGEVSRGVAWRSVEWHGFVPVRACVHARAFLELSFDLIRIRDEFRRVPDDVDLCMQRNWDAGHRVTKGRERESGRRGRREYRQWKRDTINRLTRAGVVGGGSGGGGGT